MDIGVVLVTFNRLEKLKIALGSYDKQTVKPKYILVVDNKSTDGFGLQMMMPIQKKTHLK
jgi:GT2 family glycosyltransferase